MKKMIITGASSGLGKRAVEYFASKNMLIAAVARDLSKIADIVNKNPENIFPFCCDISDSGQVERTFSEIEEQFGIADILINNAGVFQSKPFTETDVECISRILNTNLKGYMFCTLQIAAKMKKRKSGHIINISSVSGIHGIPNQSIYGASKHGINGFSDVLSQEMKEHNVHVCSICPGGINTPLWDDKNPYPLDNHLTEPLEIVKLIEFIISQNSRTIYKRIVMFPDNEWH